MSSEGKWRGGFIEVFSNGAKNGLELWFFMLIPGTFFGYAAVQFFKVLGLLDILGKVFAPLMSIFGLPGESITVLLTAALALPSGAASAASLAADGILTGRQVTVLVPMIFCVGNQVQFMGRLLSIAKVETRKYLVYCVIGILCAAISGALLNALLRP